MGLIAAWLASCVIGWIVRWAALNVTGADLMDMNIDARFQRYSTIEAASRAIQGTVFFLIVGLDRLNKALNRMES